MLSPAQCELILDLAHCGQHHTLWRMHANALQTESSLFQEVLLCAMQAGHEKSVTWLLNTTPCPLPVRVEVLRAAMKAGKVVMVSVLLGAPVVPECLNQALLWAAAQGETVWVYAFVNQPVCSSMMKRDAVVAAAAAGQLDTLEFLLGHGGIPSAQACLEAIQGGHRTVLLRLLKGCSYQVPNMKVFFVLEALKLKNFDIVYDLREYYPEVLEQALVGLPEFEKEAHLQRILTYIQENLPDFERQLMVKHFVDQGRVDIANLLIVPADVALFKAVETGNMEQLQAIVQRSPEMLYTFREQLLMTALRHQQTQMAVRLCVPGLSLSISVFLEAIVKRQPQLLDYFLKNAAPIEDPNGLNYLLQQAVTQNDADSVLILMAYGAKTEDTFGPLMQQVVRQNNLVILKLFVEQGRWISNDPVKNHAFIKTLYFSAEDPEIKKYAKTIAYMFGFFPIDLTMQQMTIPRAHVSVIGEKTRLACMQAALQQAQAFLARDSESAMFLSEVQRCRDNFDKKIKTDFELNTQFDLRGGLEGIEREIRVFVLGRLEQQLLENTEDFDYSEILEYIAQYRAQLIEGSESHRIHFRALIVQYNVQYLREAMAFHAYDATAWPVLTYAEMEAQGIFANLFIPPHISIAPDSMESLYGSFDENADLVSREWAAQETRTMAAYYYIIAELCNTQEKFIYNVAECICAHGESVHDDDPSCYTGYIRRLAQIAVGTKYGVPPTKLDLLYQTMTQKVLTVLRGEFERRSRTDSMALYDALLFLQTAEYKQLFFGQYKLPSGTTLTAEYIQRLLQVRMAFISAVSHKTQTEKDVKYYNLMQNTRRTFASEEKKMLWLARECFVLSLKPLNADITALYRQYVPLEQSASPLPVHDPETREAFLARHQHMLPQDPEARARMVARLESQFLARQGAPAVQLSAPAAATTFSAEITNLLDSASRTIGPDGIPVIRISLQARPQPAARQ